MEVLIVNDYALYSRNGADTESFSLAVRKTLQHRSDNEYKGVKGNAEWCYRSFINKRSLQTVGCMPANPRPRADAWCPWSGHPP